MANGEAREYTVHERAKSADAILVDSEIGREDVLELYGHLIAAGPRPCPAVRAPAVSRPSDRRPKSMATLADLGLPSAMSSSRPSSGRTRTTARHRGHRRGCTRGVDVTIVLTGSASGHSGRRSLRTSWRSWVRAGDRRSGSRSSATSTTTTMSCLYAGATGVVLPTFFGPTNIPVIEAWAMGVPVLTSDIRGIREQCGDAASSSTRRRWRPSPMASAPLDGRVAARARSSRPGSARSRGVTSIGVPQCDSAAILAGRALAAHDPLRSAGVPS